MALNRKPAPQTPNPSSPAPSSITATEPKQGVQAAPSEVAGVNATDAAEGDSPAAEGVGLLSAEAPVETPEGVAAPEAKSQAASGPLNGKDRAAWVRDTAFHALSSPNREPYYLSEATNAAFHTGGGKELKHKGMKEALEVGSMVAFVRMSEASFIPEGRTIQQDIDALAKSIDRREKALNDGVAKTKPEYKEKAAKDAKYELDALGVFKSAGAVALANGDQKGVRALNAILIGQGNASYIGHRMRQDSGDEKANHPLFRAAAVNQGTRGIKDPEVLLKRVKGWMAYEVTDAHKEQKTWDKQVPSAGLADARARAEAATLVSHLFAVPNEFQADRDFLQTLGRKSGTPSNYQRQNLPGLSDNQKKAVEELKGILAEHSKALPAEVNAQVAEMMASGVEVADRASGANILFKVEEPENQKQLLDHMNALVGGDEAKASEASNYFGKMPRSRELAAAVAENL